MVMVRAKAGNAQETYSFLLSQTCGLPTPTRRIYWTNIGVGTETIARTNPKTQNINQSFINTNDVGFGVAVDSSHIYWANHVTNTIGRADVDGQNVDQNFITGASRPYFVAVDSRYIYWTKHWATRSAGRIGWAKRQPKLIVTGNGPSGLAVDISHIYWVNTNYETVGRADLDGQNVDQNFIVLTGQSVGLYGLAVDSNYLYWADINNAIGRAELDGQNVNLTFISGCQQPRGVAVDRSHVYWANDGNTIGQADLDGQNVNQHFVPNCPNPFGIAVDPE